jgi:hypothetical protein
MGAIGALYFPTVAGCRGTTDNTGMDNTPQPPPIGGLGQLIRRGGRWWMWAALIGLVLGLAGLVVLQALEYLAPFVYVAL